MTDPPTPRPELITVLLDADHRDTVVEALRAQASTYRRAGIRAAGEAAVDKRAKKDVRARALKVIDILAIADTLEQTATTVEQAEVLDTDALAARWHHPGDWPDPPAASNGDHPPADPPDPDTPTDADVAATADYLDADLGTSDDDEADIR